MPLIECSFSSEVLSKTVSMKVILPGESVSGLKERSGRKEYPVLFLLHGFSDDHTAWTRNSSLERYVEGLGLAVVMPQADNSYYTDMAHGGKYWTYLTEELPLKARAMFPLSKKKEDNFVAGHSMGGFGALKWVLNRPDMFKAAASMSGVADMVFHLENVRKENSDKTKALSLVFGEGDISRTANDIIWKLEELADSNREMPLLYQTCGTEDFLYEHNIRFYEKCKELNIPITSEFMEGDHNWAYWDQAIQKILRWLPIEDSSSF
ncbi:hypothetical protein B14911_15770 [Bacillus sp. NRRL B-14911]|uniref:Esterase n=1 Tax=Bacillus infantis NRRL B-14911 TaxID=1367477 RepID=U5L8K3_9BACI|nr:MULTISPECIES: alpha/beta hydrolase family protein [Bacillus]AGX02982.1 esterase [Bacillus infantis NRRL B-14911]EAR64458.1 hypothetical protein B14911_15770 [Bacillus sp. NRRL B-14911]